MARQLIVASLAIDINSRIQEELRKQEEQATAGARLLARKDALSTQVLALAEEQRQMELGITLLDNNIQTLVKKGDVPSLRQAQETQQTLIESVNTYNANQSKLEALQQQLKEVMDLLPCIEVQQPKEFGPPVEITRSTVETLRFKLQVPGWSDNIPTKFEDNGLDIPRWAEKKAERKVKVDETVQKTRQISKLRGELVATQHLIKELGVKVTRKVEGSIEQYAKACEKRNNLKAQLQLLGATEVK